MTSVIFLGLNIGAWITIISVLAMFLTLLFTKLREDVAFLLVIAVLLLTGVLDTSQALSGFSSTSVVLVGVLFVVVTGLVHTGVLQWLVRNLMGTPKSFSSAILRLMLPVAAMSSVLSNTTIVALFVNVVKLWSKKLKIAPSKLLIPLSYAAGMGGVCTLIGTPPNLIISGLYADETGNHLNLFTTTIPGLACLIVGIGAILLLRRLLPEHKDSDDSFNQTNEYTVEMLVPADCKYIGETVGDAGLANISGGSLIEIVRFDREIISPVSPDEFLMGGDRLIFAGQVDDILALRKSHGLVNADHPVFSLSEVASNRRLHTAYIMPGFELIGKQISATTFEHDHQMTLVAVARQGERISQSPRDIELQVGDSLLIECSPRSVKSENIRGLQFTEENTVAPVIDHKTVTSSLIMLAMILLSSLNILPLLNSAIIAAIAMLVFRCCTPTQAMKAIEWNILMIFAGSVVIGTAIQQTGIAEKLANGLLSLCNGRPILVMIAMCFAANLLTEFISNTATGAIFCPIVYHAAIAMGVNPMPFLVSLMVAVSSCYASPIGSLTHMLVYGPGGYRFADFLRIGIIMDLLMLAVNLFIVNLIYPI